MKLITGIGGWPDQAGKQAVAAETEGYNMVSCGELAHDSILTMALAASATDKIELQTSVTIAFPRSPMVLAMEAWDIQRLSKGRFSIGLGSQVKGHNERRFGGSCGDVVVSLKDGAKLEMRSLPEFDRNMKFMMDQLPEGVAEDSGYPDQPARAFLDKVASGDEPPVELPPLSTMSPESSASVA